MNRRGNESPMDFEWQTHAPADVTSPFHKLAMEHQLNNKKRTHSAFDSPSKGSSFADQKPESQPLFFSRIPPEAKPSSSAYRTPSFTTPRKPVDIDFSSGQENVSSPEQADNEDTPEAQKPVTMFFTANETKPANRRSSLFNLYGRIALPRPDILKSSHSNVLIRRAHKRRKREQNLGRQIALPRRPSGDSSDEEPHVRQRKNTAPEVHKVGYMAGLFTFIESFPNAPSLLAKYLQLFFNSAIILGCLYMIYSFWKTIQDDVNRASEDAAAETLAEMAACAKSYVDNRCAGNSRLPALETVCSNWELCMNRDPNSVKRAKLSAHTFAEILNSFVEPISLKTMIFAVTTIILSLAISNATFGYLRNSNALNTHHNQPYGPPPDGMHRHPSSSGPPYGPNYGQQFPPTPSHAQQHLNFFGDPGGPNYQLQQQQQQQMGWYADERDGRGRGSPNKALEYTPRESPRKGRSQSPDKRFPSR